jgi:prepilin-type N-terminal cleavage/methylation domain-containing protein
VTNPCRESKVESRKPTLGWPSALDPRPSTLAAFTLLEVLIALAIFALAAVVLGATYVNALNAYEAVSRRNA